MPNEKTWIEYRIEEMEAMAANWAWDSEYGTCDRGMEFEDRVTFFASDRFARFAWWDEGSGFWDNYDGSN